MAVDWSDSRFLDGMKRAVARGVFRGAELVRSEAIRLILEGGKSGRIYRRKGVEHQASAPGEAPASDTGRLVNSLETRYEEEGMVGIVSVHAQYGEFLEFGTIKMEPRPFMRPALATAMPDIIDAIRDEVRKQLDVQSRGEASA